jgi:Flp pilus assembly pilin Flp
VRRQRLARFACDVAQLTQAAIQRKQALGTMVKKFLRDETGLEVSEYAIAGALLILILVYRLFGTAINKQVDFFGTQHRTGGR